MKEEEINNQLPNSIAEPKPQLASYGSFDEAPLDPLVKEAILQINWKEPTQVQKVCLPYSLKGKDLAGFAQTGTGKTGVFLITLAQKFISTSKKQSDSDKKKPHSSSPFSVVICPTRELAIQIQEDFRKLSNLLKISSMAVFGGSSWENQAKDLRKGQNVIVATPGRLKDFISKNIIDMSQIEILICDEVDRMFDMGFIEDIEFIFAKTNPNAQKLIFSATTNERVKELAFEYLDHPEYISVNPDEIAPESIEQHAHLCESPDKFKVLLGLIKEHNPSRAIVFVNTKITGSWLHYKLKGNNISAELITGDLPQVKRIRLINKIKEGKLKLLIATDVASRGLHISNVTHVYNFDVPDDAASYVHRIGRTARAGDVGYSYTMVCEDYAHNYTAIEALLGDIAPKPVWFDNKYLQIKDLSGNPFEDNFGEEKEPAPQSNYNRKDYSRDKESFKRPSGNYKQKQHRSSGQRRSAPPTRQQHKKQSSDKKKSKISIPTTMGAIIKRIFSLFMPKKKNKK